MNTSLVQYERSTYPYRYQSNEIVKYNISNGESEGCMTPSAHNERRNNDTNSGVLSHPDIQWTNKPVSAAKEFHENSKWYNTK